MKKTFQLFILFIASISALNASINFSVNFTAQAQSDLDATQQAMFTDGVAFWGTKITGYRDGVSRSWALSVDTFSKASVGGGVLLGSAGPSGLGWSEVVADSHTSNKKFILSTAGTSSFNVHQDAGTLRASTIKHEIGHALGIGTLWEDNELQNDGIADNHNRTLAGGTAGQYVGAAALGAYQVEYFGQRSATFVPIELDGGDGTANGHWDEVHDNFVVENLSGVDSHPGDEVAAPTIVGGANFAESLDNELMTGVSSASNFFSNTTLGSLYDIGFTIVDFEVVPEPASAALFCSLLSLAVVCRRRRKSF